MKYLGKLDHADPFYGFLKEHVLPQITAPHAHPEFSVQVLKGSNQVFLYTEEKSGVSVVGKFFYGIVEREWSVAARYLQQEWDSLHTFRFLGFDKPPYYVPRPLGCSHDINCVLVEEYCPGTMLSEYIKAGIRGKHGKLYRRLTSLAAFFAKLHNSTARPQERVYFETERQYANRLINTLRKRHHIHHDQAEALYHWIDLWSHKEIMWQDNSVLVHGDATPANILFRDHTEIVAIDLERARYSDRLFDIGRIAGEIKHAFLLESDDPANSEPFIGHFLWEYCTHFPDCGAAFYSITRRIPFYVAITLLRIARNGWVSDNHRKKLIDQAFLNFHYQG